MNQGYQISSNPLSSNLMYGYYMPSNYSSNNSNDERLVGGFAFPFLLGGVTGAALAPAFWRPNYGYNRPFYGPGPYYPYPPRRWF